MSPNFNIEQARQVDIRRLTASPRIDSKTGSKYVEPSADDDKVEGKRKGEIPLVGKLKDIKVLEKKFEVVESDRCSFRHDGKGESGGGGEG